MSHPVAKLPADGRGRNQPHDAFARIEKFLDGRPWLVTADDIPPGGVGAFLGGLRRRATKRQLRVIGRTDSHGALFVQAVANDGKDR